MTVTIGRRELLAALGSAAALPLAARAQQPGLDGSPNWLSVAAQLDIQAAMPMWCNLFK